MEITEVKLHLRKEEKLKAYANITFDNCFVVRDLKVISGNAGLFVAMPSRKKPDGSFKDIAHALNNETRLMIEAKVLEAYNNELLGVKVEPKAVEVKPETGAETLDRKMSDLEKSLEDKFSSI